MADEDTRKRVYQQDELDAAISSKRAALGHGHSQAPFPHEESTEPLFFKLLCPQGVTGLIIGKGGANIIQLNTTTGARIKLSQNNEYFPNTSDRILLISGGREGMQNAVRELVTRIVEAPEKRTPDYGNPAGSTHNNRGANGSFVVRVLVPKHSSASIIGKGGSVIKRMTELSGCRFQLGEEADPYNSNERIVTVTGPTSTHVVTGAITVMNTLLDDPRIRVYSNPTTNYSGRPPHGSGPVPMGAPGMHPHMMGPPPSGMMPPQPAMMGYGPPGPYMAPYPGMPQPMPQHMGHPMFQQGVPTYAPQYGGMPTSAPMQTPVAPMYPGYPPVQTGEVPQSYQPPAHYGGAKPVAYGAPSAGMAHPSPYQGGMHPPKMN